MIRSRHSDNSMSSAQSVAGGRAKARHAQQQIACDRCRGQKLRCIRPTARGTCNRCQKAGATCVTDPTVRMGRRPRNASKNDKDNDNAATAGAGQALPKRRTSSPSSQYIPSYPVSESSHTIGSAWTDSDPSDDMIDLSCSESISFGVPVSTFDDISMQMAQNECFDNSVHLIPPHVTPGFSHFTMDGIKHDVSAGKSPLEGMVAQPSAVFLQEPIARVSSLNLEVRQQLAVINEIMKGQSSKELGLLDGDEAVNAICSKVPFMIQGLQVFHDAVQDVLCPQQDAATAPAETTIAEFMPDVNSGSNNEDQQARSSSDTVSHQEIDPLELISPTVERDASTMDQPWKPHNLDMASQDVLFDLHTHSQQDGETSETAFLDVSSSLLVISCYINLVIFCRAVFHSIRSAIAVGRCQQTSLAPLAGLHVSGIFVSQDPDLQLVILIQVVIRLVDNIGMTLWHPHGKEAGDADVGMNGKRFSKVISPQLLEFLLEQEGMGEQLPEGGVKALRQEIRKLNEVVYKAV